MPALKQIVHDCKRATFLVEKKLAHRISLRETFELRIHLFSCSVCRIFAKQSLYINLMVQQFFKNNNTQAPLDDTFKLQLQHRIDEELNKS